MSPAHLNPSPRVAIMSPARLDPYPVWPQSCHYVQGLPLMLACVAPSQKGSTSCAEIVGHRVPLSPLHTVGRDPCPLHILGSTGPSRQQGHRMV